MGVTVTGMFPVACMMTDLQPEKSGLTIDILISSVWIIFTPFWLSYRHAPSEYQHSTHSACLMRDWFYPTVRPLLLSRLLGSHELVTSAVSSFTGRRLITLL